MPDRPLHAVQVDLRTRAGFISDLHLSPNRPDIEERLRRFLGDASARLDTLFILGDLFEFWIGDDAASLCGHDGVESMLAAFFRESGCRGFVMHGNRDFLIGNDFCERVGCTLLADPCILDAGGAHLLLSHGDAYCTDDVEHQRFRAMVHEPSWQEAFLARAPGDRLAFALDARSQSESGKSGKSPEIMDVNNGAVEKAMSSHGVRVMIHGHTHRPAIHRHVVEDTGATRVVLGDWFDQPNSLTVADGAIHYELAGETRVIELDGAP